MTSILSNKVFQNIRLRGTNIHILMIINLGGDINLGYVIIFADSSPAASRHKLLNPILHTASGKNSQKALEYGGPL
jgi:hypothetical protein